MKTLHACLSLLLVTGFIACQPDTGSQSGSGTEQKQVKGIDTLSIEKAIREVMADQQEAWNRGDIEGFMDGYSRSDSTLFAGKNRVNYGWNTVLESYRKGYPDGKAMGQLQFTLIRVRVLSEHHAYVVGKWELTENTKPASGHFVLIFEKSPEGWKIAVDGTS